MMSAVGLFFQTELNIRKLVAAAQRREFEVLYDETGPRPEATTDVSSCIEEIKPSSSSIERLWDVLRKARQDLYERLNDQTKSKIEPELLRAITVGEFILANLGAGGVSGLTFLCSKLDDEIDLGAGLTCHQGLLAHASLRSMGWAAASALEIMMDTEDQEAGGETMAKISAGSPQLQDEVWALFESSDFKRPLLCHSFFQTLSLEERHPERLVKACRKVDDVFVKNELLSLLKKTSPQHPELPRLLKSCSAISNPKAQLPPFHRDGRFVREWLEDYLDHGSPQAAQNLASMILGWIEDGDAILEVEGEGAKEFEAILQSSLQEQGPVTPQGIFLHLASVEEPGAATLTESLIVDSALAQSVGRKAAKLESQLKEFVKSQSGNFLSRGYVYELIGRSENEAFLSTILAQVKQSERHKEPVPHAAIQAGARLLEGLFSEQIRVLDLALEQEENAILELLNWVKNLSPLVTQRLLPNFEQPWIDQNLVVRLLGRAEAASDSIIELLGERCHAEEPYTRAVAQEALACCWGDDESCLQHISSLLEDEGYGFAAYEGWVGCPVSLLRKYKGKAVTLTEKVERYSQEEDNVLLLIDFLEGLDSELPRASQTVQRFSKNSRKRTLFNSMKRRGEPLD